MSDSEVPQPETATDQTTDLGHGVTYQWIENERILVVRMGEPTREAVDIWANFMLDLFKNWPANKRLLTLQDQSSDKMTVTPYMRQRANEVDQASAKLATDGRLAMVLYKSITTTIVKLVANSFGSQNRSIERRFFTNTDEALAWLKAAL